MCLSIAGTLLGVSCRPAAATPTYEPPRKLIPAYGLDIRYPSSPGVVTVVAGGSVTLPVRIWSMVDQPIEVRPALTAPGNIPWFVQYEEMAEYTSLGPGGEITAQVIIKVAGDAPPGSYVIGVTARLREPVKERGGVAMMFSLVVASS